MQKATARDTRRFAATAAARKPKSQKHFRLLSPKTRQATASRVAMEWRRRTATTTHVRVEHPNSPTAAIN